MKKFITTKELCTQFGFSRSWLYKSIGAREIPHYRKGNGKIFFIASEIEDWLAEGKVEELTNQNIIDHLSNLK